MANSTMKDAFTAASVAAGAADYTTAFTLQARGTLTEVGKRNQIIRKFDDGTEERITLATRPIFDITIPFRAMDSSDCGTVFDYYFDPAKANCRARTFKFTHWDGYSYVGRFDMDLQRGVTFNSVMNTEVKIRVFSEST